MTIDPGVDPNMIIVICDVCNSQVLHDISKTITLVCQDKVFDVGSCCLDKPFRIPPSARPKPRKGQPDPVQVRP